MVRVVEGVGVVGIVVVAGAGDVDDNSFGAFFFEDFDGGGVAGFAEHDAVAVEEELGDVGEGGGIAAGDAMQGEILQEFAKEEVDGGWGREVVDAGEEFGRGGLAVGVEASFGFGASVVDAERGVIGSVEHAAAAVEVGAMFTLGVGCEFAGHGCGPFGLDKVASGEWRVARGWRQFCERG